MEPSNDKFLISKRSRSLNNYKCEKTRNIPIESSNLDDNQIGSISKEKETKIDKPQKKALTEKKKIFKVMKNTSPLIINNFNNINNFNIYSNSISAIEIIDKTSQGSNKECLMELLVDNDILKTYNFKSSIFQELTIKFIHKQNPNMGEKEIKECMTSTGNYHRIEELKFLKNLAIVLEGNDFCSAAGWSTLDPNNIYVTSNKIGSNSNTDSRKPIQNSLINNVIDDLLGNKINLDNYDECKNLLEILLANIIFNSSKNSFSYYDSDDKSKYMKYLHIYFKGRRPRRKLRKIYGISNLLVFPRTQVRIKRFIEAIKALLISPIYKNLVTNKKLNINLHAKSANVHSEMKLMNYFIEKVVGENPIKLNSDEKIDIYIAPSRIPCKNCSLVISKVNELSLNGLKFIVPLSINPPRMFKFILPSFLKNENTNYIFRDILDELKNLDKIENNKSKEKIEILSPNSNTTDKQTLPKINSFFTFEDSNNLSVSRDEIIIEDLIKNAVSIFEFIKGYGDNEKVLFDTFKNLVDSYKKNS